MKKIITLFVLILVSISACKPKMKPPAGDFTIHGQVDGVDTLIFEKIEANSLFLVDTIYAVDGEFVLANSLEGSAFFILRTPQGDGINLLIEKGEHIEITGEKIDWNNNYSIYGSEGSNHISNLNKKLSAFEADINAIYEEARVAKREDFVDIQDRFNNLFEEHKSFIKNFIDNNINSKATILALFQAAKGENILNLHSDFDYYKKVADSFNSRWPNSSHTQFLNEIVGIAFAADFTLPDVNDNMISLSDFKGKLILLDFWASWCKPCRNANPEMVKLYTKYHNKGLEIISISLDGTPQQKNPKQDWLDAIEKDKMTWTQLSDLKGWDTDIRNKYPFRSIPHTVLIDSTGRIIGENIEELDLKIAQLLNL